MVKVLNGLSHLLAGLTFVFPMVSCAASPAPIVLFDTPQESSKDSVIKLVSL